MDVLTAVDEDRIAAHRKDDEFFWLDLESPDEADVDALQAALGLHPMAHEDTREFGQAPKVDVYHSYVLVVFFTALESADPDRVVQPVEVHVYVSGSWIVTVHQAALPALEQLHQRACAGRQASGGLPRLPDLRRADRRLLPRHIRDRGPDRHDRGRGARSGHAASCSRTSTASSRRCTRSSA